MRVARPALGVAIFAAAIAVAWHLRPTSMPTAKPENVADSAPTQADGAANVGARPLAVADAPFDAASPAAEAVPASTASVPTPAPLPGETPATPMAELLERRHHVLPQRQAELARVTRNEREFAAEPVDVAWAPGAEAELLGRLAQISGLALTDLRVECRSTMCRVQVALPMTQDAQARNPLGEPPGFANSLGLETRWLVTIGDQSRTLQSVAYLWREGLRPEQGGEAVPK